MKVKNTVNPPVLGAFVSILIASCLVMMAAALAAYALWSWSSNTLLYTPRGRSGSKGSIPRERCPGYTGHYFDVSPRQQLPSSRGSSYTAFLPARMNAPHA